MSCRSAIRKRQRALKAMAAPLMGKVVLGEKGLTKVRSVIEREDPVIGTFTSAQYPFQHRPEMYVDNRDLITMLGNDLWIVE